MIFFTGRLERVYRCLLLVSLILLPARLVTQEPQTEPAELPRGFDEIQLGLSMNQLKERLKAAGSFYYRGDPDVSLLERENRTLLEAEGVGYIDSGQFQLNDVDRLFVILLVLDESLIDYFTLYTTFSEKYGPPNDLSPERAVWENGLVRVSLERPAAVRYIDTQAFEEMAAAGEAIESYEGISREEFLSRF